MITTTPRVKLANAPDNYLTLLDNGTLTLKNGLIFAKALRNVCTKNKDAEAFYKKAKQANSYRPTPVGLEMQGDSVRVVLCTSDGSVRLTQAQTIAALKGYANTLACVRFETIYQKNTRR